jgi:transposase InsO family protein
LVFIHVERDTYPITFLCHVMQMARSGYHVWALREDCDRAREDRVLAVHIVALFENSRWTYGSPRFRIDLQEDGMRVGRSRITQPMRENGLIARRKKAFQATPGACPTDWVSPNRLDRKFTARAPNRKWVTDVKCVRTSAGWLYLAPVIDLFSRRVVGCAMSTEQDGKLSVAALTSARGARQPAQCHRALGPRRHLRRRRVHEEGQRTTAPSQHEPHTQSMGQRGDREALQHALP